jgi:hypothetical protein
MDNVQKMLLQIITNHRQNPLDFIYYLKNVALEASRTLGHKTSNCMEEKINALETYCRYKNIKYGEA